MYTARTKSTVVRLQRPKRVGRNGSGRNIHTAPISSRTDSHTMRRAHSQGHGASKALTAEEAQMHARYEEAEAVRDAALKRTPSLEDVALSSILSGPSDSGTTSPPSPRSSRSPVLSGSSTPPPLLASSPENSHRRTTSSDDLASLGDRVPAEEVLSVEDEISLQDTPHDHQHHPHPLKEEKKNVKSSSTESLGVKASTYVSASPSVSPLSTLRKKSENEKKNQPPSSAAQGAVGIKEMDDQDFQMNPAYRTPSQQRLEIEEAFRPKRRTAEDKELESDDEDIVKLEKAAKYSLSDGFSYQSYYRFPLGGKKEGGGACVARVRWLRNRPHECCSVASDGQMCFYNITRKLRLVTYRAYPRGTGGVTSLDFAHGERFMLTTGNEEAVKLWSRKRRDRPIAVYRTASRATVVRCHPSIETRFFVGHADGTLAMLDATSGKSTELELLDDGFSHSITALCCSSGGKYIICADSACNLTVLVNSGRGVYDLGTRLNLHCLKITGLEYCNAMHAVLVSCCDSKMRLMQIPSLKLLQVFFHTHSSQQLHATMSNKSGLAITGSEDGNIHMFDAQSGTLFTSIKTSQFPVTSVDISTDENVLISGSFDGVHVYKKV